MHAEVQRALFNREDAGTALDASNAHFTFNLRRRELHRLGFRFHNMTVRVKLIDVAYTEPAFLICVGMLHINVEYDALAARIGRLFADRLVQLRGDVPEQSDNGMPQPKYLLQSLVKPGRIIKDEGLKVKIKRRGFAVARDENEYTALPFVPPGWSQPSHLKLCRRSNGWPVSPMKKVVRRT